MITFYIVIILFVIALLLVSYVETKPNKVIVNKYGQPLAHFTTRKCWNSLPIKGTKIHMDFYENFVVISGNCIHEVCINNDYQDYEIMGSYLRSVLELNIDSEKIQIDLTKKQKKLLEDFFENK